MLFDSSLAIWDMVSGECVKMLQQRGDRNKVSAATDEGAGSYGLRFRVLIAGFEFEF